ncbi:MAG: adenylosuccinate lyase [Candidatus Omnitrophica bacterium]|nr:adenylosuccinate lyase [Candidatus Omnitrophota bacterium]
MIDRYTLPEMGRIWTEENRFRRMLDVEVAACLAMAELNLIPREAARKIQKKAGFRLPQIARYEKTTKHDVTAFLKSVADFVGTEARFIHKGLTSSDVLDTGLSLQMREALGVLEAALQELTALLKTKALRHKDVPMMGRTHGVHAEPVTLGLKFLVFYEEFKRNLTRLEAAKRTISFGKISGAVGTYANLDPRVEEKALRKLGLAPAPISTQILQRDRHAEVLTSLALLGGSLEKLATEIRHLQKTEVLELEEPFSEGQTGSSAMPHKRNPVNCERIAGLSRVLRANALAALENIALWHERDITHSSVERIILPDSFIMAHFMLREMIAIIKGLQVYPERMLENIAKTRGLIFSQRVLLALIDKGLSREEAYRIVQRNAMRVWKEKGVHLKDLLAGEKEVASRFSKNEFEDIFKLDYYLRHVRTIFGRVLKKRRYLGL